MPLYSGISPALCAVISQKNNNKTIIVLTSLAAGIVSVSIFTLEDTAVFCKQLLTKLVSIFYGS